MSLPRHARAVGAAWKAEDRRRRTASRRWTDTQFLPAALEVAEAPPSPTDRLILWLIIAAAILALTWACLAKVDVVATAEGRLVPSGRLRTVEAADQGVIRSILVREGEHVTAGQPLIELDPTVAQADVESARTELSTAALTRARDNAILSYAMGRGAALATPAGSDAAAADAERVLVAARIEDYQAKRASLDQRLVAAEATAQGAAAEIKKLELTLPLLKQQLDDQVDLERQGFGARQKMLQQQAAYITAQQDLEGKRAKLAEARAQALSIVGDSAQAKGQFVGQAAQERAEAEGVVATKGDAVRKADDKKSLQTLVAPVSGIIQEVAVTTIGQVPEVGKPLVTIVPDGEALVVEALLLNRDAGSVRAGMPAVIKLEPTYPCCPISWNEMRIERDPDSM